MFHTTNVVADAKLCMQVTGQIETTRQHPSGQISSVVGALAWQGQQRRATVHNSPRGKYTADQDYMARNSRDEWPDKDAISAAEARRPIHRKHARQYVKRSPAEICTGIIRRLRRQRRTDVIRSTSGRWARSPPPPRRPAGGPRRAAAEPSLKRR